MDSKLVKDVATVLVIGMDLLECIAVKMDYVIVKIQQRDKNVINVNLCISTSLPMAAREHAIFFYIQISSISKSNLVRILFA